jgi:chitin disaccharide deacetylase
MHSKERLQKRLIINADDFGLGPAINRGVMEGFENGIITNTSLSSCGAAFDEAIEFARRRSNLGVGIHLTLNEECPVSHKDNIKSLLDGDSFLNFSAFLKRFFSCRIVLEEVRLEFESQMQRFIKTGIKPTHLDSHKHIHMLPGIFEIVLGLAKKYNIRSVRFSRSAMFDILKSQRFFRAFGVFGLSILAVLQLPKIREYSIAVPDNCYGLIESGSLDEKQVCYILKHIRHGASEIFCHPADSGIKGDSLGYNRKNELKAFTSYSVKELIRKLDIKLIRYDEI